MSAYDTAVTIAVVALAGWLMMRFAYLSDRLVDWWRHRRELDRIERRSRALAGLGRITGGRR